MFEVGKCYYVIAHAYHHFIGRCVEVGGPNRAKFTEVIRVYSCKRGWTEFFRDGIGDDTKYTHWPDKWLSDCTGGPADWNHSIPQPPKAMRKS